jgi:hypothetical protein
MEDSFKVIAPEPPTQKLDQLFEEFNQFNLLNNKEAAKVQVSKDLKANDYFNSNRPSVRINSSQFLGKPSTSASDRYSL